ncbi:MAG: S9 family peptidase [Oligoflexia bacterium]|nr:S9 family peptidase [Oligoflexia bacterium]
MGSFLSEQVISKRRGGPMISSLIFILMTIPLLAQAQMPPQAPQMPYTHNLHGDLRLDPYYWMLTYPGSPHPQELIEYLTSENNYAVQKTASQTCLRRELYREMIDKVPALRHTVSIIAGDKEYFVEQVKNLPYVRVREYDRLSKKGRILIDANLRAFDGGHYEFQFLGLSPTKKLLAFSETNRQDTVELYIQNIETEEIRKIDSDVASHIGIAWSQDGEKLFYAKSNELFRAQRVIAHSLISSSSEVIFSEVDAEFELESVSNSLDGRYLFIESASNDSSETHYLDLRNTNSRLKVFQKRTSGLTYSVQVSQGGFLVMATDENSAETIYQAPFDQTDLTHWKPLYRPKSNEVLSDYVALKEHVALIVRRRGQPEVRVLHLRTNKIQTLEIELPYFEVEFGEWGMPLNHDYAHSRFQFIVRSFTSNGMTYSYDIKNQRQILEGEKDALENFTASDYRITRLSVPARDGIKIPVSLIYRKGLDLKKTHPLILNAYGAYGDPFFLNYHHSYSVETAAPMLDRNVIIAIAHVRGGGEFGEPWHEQGMVLTKKTTFFDVIDVARELTRRNISQPSKMAFRSLSAGGLIVGFIANNEPSLFKAMVGYMPFVDLINSMSDEKIPLTTQEWQEWGNPHAHEHYNYMKSYCPYTNIGAHEYPHMLIKTALFDKQVLVHEPAKFVAKLRTTKTDSNDLLLSTNMQGSHDGGANFTSQFEESAFDYAWILTKLGINCERTEKGLQESRLSPHIYSGHIHNN